MSEELKPCPWCGGAAKVFQKYPDPKRSNWRVICDNASDCAMDPYNDFETPEEAAAAWNRRASPSTEGDARREALEEAAKVVEAKHTNNVGMVHPMAQDDAKAIRALKETKP